MWEQLEIKLGSLIAIQQENNPLKLLSPKEDCWILSRQNRSGNVFLLHDNSLTNFFPLQSVMKISCVHYSEHKFQIPCFNFINQTSQFQLQCQFISIFCVRK